MDKIEAHVTQYDKDQIELNNKIAGIFRRLNDMSNRWLIVSGAVVMVLLGVNGYLVQDRLVSPDSAKQKQQQQQMEKIIEALEVIAEKQRN